MTFPTLYATQFFDGTGTASTYSFSFAGVRPEVVGVLPYLDEADVLAVLITPGTALTPRTETPLEVTFVGPNQVTLLPTPPVGTANVKIYRQTNSEYPEVDFIGNAAVQEADLDINTRQLIFLTQESADKAALANFDVGALRDEFEAGDYGVTGADIVEAVADHADQPDPHPQYAEDGDAEALLAAHVAELDPHTQYTTAVELAAAVAAHEAVVDPHPQYTTAVELAAAIAAATSVGRLVDVQVYTATGAHTWTKPGGLTASAFVIVEAQGAGGGSANATSNVGECNLSAAGGAGGYARAKMAASLLSATEPVVVGAGSLGAAGGNSDFGTFGVSRVRGGGGGANNSTLGTGTSVAAAPRNGFGGEGSVTAGVVLASGIARPGVNGLRLSGSSAIVPLGGPAIHGGVIGTNAQTSVSSFESSVGATLGAGANGAVGMNGATASGAAGGDGFVIVYTYA